MSQKEDNKTNSQNQAQKPLDEMEKNILNEEECNPETNDNEANSEKGEPNAKFSEKEELEESLKLEKDKFLRLFAEFENYKKRTNRERLEMFKTANQEVITALLPVMDDFDRAIKEILKANEKNLLKGIELIHNKFKETLRSKGLELVKVEEGDVFDAEIHEAVTQIPAPREELKGKIVDVVEKGYKLGDRIIRYPKVVTGK